ncbi:MAG TPA: hypothetical protein VHV77_16135 [Pirellulales bacterium]|nr:hypothetical protein [Pirellulales bacterium]
MRFRIRHLILFMVICAIALPIYTLGLLKSEPGLGAYGTWYDAYPKAKDVLRRLGAIVLVVLLGWLLDVFDARRRAKQEGKPSTLRRSLMRMGVSVLIVTVVASVSLAWLTHASAMAHERKRILPDALEPKPDCTMAGRTRGLRLLSVSCFAAFVFS